MIKKFKLENYSKAQQRIIMGVRLTMIVADYSDPIPFTFAEFHGREVEETVCEFTHQGETITQEQLFNAHVKSNFGIADMYAYFYNEAGEMVYKHAVRALRAGEKDLQFDRVGETDMMGVNGPVFSVDTWGEYPTAGTYTVKVEVQLATGERPTVYSGVLTV